MISFDSFSLSELFNSGDPGCQNVVLGRQSSFFIYNNWSLPLQISAIFF